jgi:hypothetical protein
MIKSCNHTNSRLLASGVGRLRAQVPSEVLLIEVWNGLCYASLLALPIYFLRVDLPVPKIRLKVADCFDLRLLLQDLPKGLWALNHPVGILQKFWAVEQPQFSKRRCLIRMLLVILLHVLLVPSLQLHNLIQSLSLRIPNELLGMKVEKVILDQISFLFKVMFGQGNKVSLQWVLVLFNIFVLNLHELTELVLVHWLMWVPLCFGFSFLGMVQRGLERLLLC